jgi:hypothetical protein
MQPELERNPPLSPQRAFVVQFHAYTEFGAGQVSGRVEHVVSGQATAFSSLEALLAFMGRVLREVRTANLVIMLFTQVQIVADCIGLT